MFHFNSIDCPIRWTWITLIGPDAQDFLHRVTTVHTKSLQIGQGASGCFLTPQGKIRVYFKLWCIDQNAYAFEFDSGSPAPIWREELLGAIEQYTFSENMTLSQSAKEWESIWIFGDPTQTAALAQEDMTQAFGSSLAPQNCWSLPEGIRVCRHSDSDYSRPWFSLWASKERLQRWLQQHDSILKPTSFEALEQWRIQSLRPRVGSEIQEQNRPLPLEVGLNEAVSDQKGCYPGQEVIEKIIALGAPPRRLVLLSGARPASSQHVPQQGDLLMSRGTVPIEIGQLTSIMLCKEHKDQFIGLGIVKKNHAKEGLEVQFSDVPGKSPTLATIKKIAPYA